MQKSQQGFTLIEAMVTVLVLSIGLIGVTKMQLSVALNTQLARQRGEAVLLAQSRIEGLRGLAAACSAVTDAPVTPSTQGSTSYTLKIACPTTSEVTVTVTWLDSRGASNNVVLSTTL